MTNTEIVPARWVTASRTVRHSETAVSLLRMAAPGAEVESLFTALTKIRGAHRVEIRRNPGEVIEGRYVESLWFSVVFRGTERAVRGASNLLMLSGLQEVDPNADHDHARCIASARSMGVPPAWAHMPETYLSS